tara:strand:- start:28 stop:213 length:186 start_codon:yes stop_codon:yes gene_type:complete
MIKSIQEGYNLLFLVFVIICLYGSGNSEQLKEDYTPVANNNIEELRTESDTEWGSITDPSY